jgi:hypothetical protein
LDPIHAGLPVAGLYLILSVCSFNPLSRESRLIEGLQFATKDKEGRDSLFDGLENTADVVRRYVYLRSRGRTMHALRDAILTVFEQIFEFEARALCHCQHNMAFQTFKNMFGGNGWKDSLTRISYADATARSYSPR